MANIKQRLAKLEAGAPDPLHDVHRFEVRRLSAEVAVRRNTEAANVLRKMYCPDGPLGEPRDTGIRIVNMADLIRVERSIDAHERAAVLMRDLVERYPFTGRG